MRRSTTKKAILTTATVFSVIFGIVCVAFAYQEGIVFVPSSITRDLQENHVLLSEEEQVFQSEHETKNMDDTLLQKDQGAEERIGTEQEKNSEYYMNSESLAEVAQVAQVTGQGDAEQTFFDSMAQNGIADAVYTLAKDSKDADFVIRGGITDGIGSGDGGYAIAIPGNTVETEQPQKPERPSTAGGASGNKSSSSSDGNAGGSGGGSAGGDTPAPAPTPAPTPTPDITIPANSAKDPESEKANLPGGVQTLPYIEGVTPKDGNDVSGDNPSVIIGKSSQYGETAALYVGQEVDAKKIFYSLITYVEGKDGKSYLWGADALDIYVRIDGISFDGGVNWITQFPVTIPENIGQNQMRIKASYRLSTKGNWVERQIPYEPEQSRIFVLSEPITEENEVIDTQKILNDLQFLPLGNKLNLMSLQGHFLERNMPLNELFPGWKENGTLVPWFYTVTGGRHILEPADMVPLGDEYTVTLQSFWMSDQYDVGKQYRNLCYLQTLEYIFFNWGNWNAQLNWDNFQWQIDTLTIPEYIQAISLTGVCGEVNQLELPASVLYIAPLGQSLKVHEKYQVADENLKYSSNEDGLLFNKKQTELLDVPDQKTEVSIPASVKTVKFMGERNITTLYLEATSEEEIPEIEMEYLSNCKILVSEDLLEAFMEKNAKSFNQGNGICVASREKPENIYTLQNDFLIDQQGNVRRLLPSENYTIVLPEQTKRIQQGSFSERKSVKTLIIPENVTSLVLEHGCFWNSGIRKILCSNETQMSLIQKQITAMGLADTIQVTGPTISKEGYVYLQDENGAMVIQAPKSVTKFDGTLTSADGKSLRVTTISDAAFAECDRLQWVLLPESITQIGAYAFRNCTALEWTLIDTKDTITIGDGAWEGCISLRFVASNATHGIMKNGYAPLVTDDYSNGKNRYFFVPTNATGYGDFVINFVEESDVVSYRVENIGKTGKMLYGIGVFGDSWLALRSSQMVDEMVSLPSDTLEIFNYAMADTQSATGAYTIAWEDLPQLRYFDEGAFYASGLAGDIALLENSRIADVAFANCTELTGITILGDQSFIGREAFIQCRKLRSVVLDSIRDGVQAGTFTGCDQLERITLGGNSVLSLSLEMPGWGYQFNASWFPEEEQEKLKIVVQEQLKLSYVKAWRYLFAGYGSLSYQSAYQQLWNDIQYELFWDNWEMPEDEEVDIIVEQWLLKAENRVRMMLGMETVSEPTDYYPYHEKDGYLTLVGAPSNIESLELTGDVLDFPEGWCLDYIGTNAFVKSKNLQKIMIPETLIGIEQNAFTGVQSELLTLEFAGDQPPELMNWSQEEPFQFGVEKEHLRIEVPSGREIAYLQKWIFPMVGYENLAAMRRGVGQELSNGENVATIEEIDAEIGRRLLNAENHLRKMLGLEELASAENLSCISWSEDPLLLEEFGETSNPEEKIEPEEPKIPEESSDQDDAGALDNNGSSLKDRAEDSLNDLVDPDSEIMPGEEDDSSSEIGENESAELSKEEGTVEQDKKEEFYGESSEGEDSAREKFSEAQKEASDAGMCETEGAEQE